MESDVMIEENDWTVFMTWESLVVGTNILYIKHIKVIALETEENLPGFELELLAWWWWWWCDVPATATAELSDEMERNEKKWVNIATKLFQNLIEKYD